jgi:predicted Rossmann-fold nucleotide-binding protein
MHLAMRAAALVVFPGGFGTLDELFEILTLTQTRKAPSIPIVCFDRDYWTRIINFEALVEEGMIRAADLRLFDFANNAEEAWEKLIARGLT